MKHTIRRSVFETNSSSSHNITISPEEYSREIPKEFFLKDLYRNIDMDSDPPNFIIDDPDLLLSYIISILVNLEYTIHTRYADYPDEYKTSQEITPIVRDFINRLEFWGYKINNIIEYLSTCRNYFDIDLEAEYTIHDMLAIIYNKEIFEDFIKHGIVDGYDDGH